MELDFFREFSENNRIHDFMKTCPVGVELFHECGRRTDRLTDMTKLIVGFRNVANVPKMRAIKIVEVEKEPLHTCTDQTAYDKINLTNEFNEIPLRVNIVEHLQDINPKMNLTLLYRHRPAMNYCTILYRFISLFFFFCKTCNFCKEMSLLNSL